MNMNNDLTQDFVRQMVNYDPETGLFTWNNPRGKTKRGKPAGSIHGATRYITLSLKRKNYLAHRIAFLWMTGRWPEKFIDHINQNRQDNRWANLREADAQLNTLNSDTPRGHNKSGFQGVRTLGRYGYAAALMIDGKARYLGFYKTPQEAHDAYLRAKATVLPPGPIV